VVKMQVIAISESDDHHVHKVMNRMKERSMTGLFIQTDQIFKSKTTWLVSPRRATIHPVMWNPSTTVVWNRSRTLTPAYMTEPVNSFIQQEIEGYLSVVLNQYRTAKWVSKRDSLMFARSKIDQLVQAQKFGLTIPDTIVTTSEEDLKDFFEQHNGQIITKPIQTQVVWTSGDSLVFGTRWLTVNELGSACSHTACLAQAAVDIDAEVRVVTFGRECHAFKMTPSQKVEDLKQLELSDIHHEVFELGTILKKQIGKLMDYYDLEFSACDFILKPDGELVFLELNPNGQWLWLEYKTGFDLTDRFIDFLNT